jgi:hypothetical protein
MARARRSKPGQVKGDWTPITPTLPDTCPLCGQKFIEGNLDMRAEMPTHLQSHAPAEICQRCDGTGRAWRLDADGATHFRADVSIFYCSNCGRYAPVEMAPQD